MSDRRQILFGILAFVAVIALMTWHDLRPEPPRQVGGSPPILSDAYLIHPDMPASAIPQDDSELVIWQGTVRAAVLDPPAAPPLTLPQRQIDLMFGMPALPAAYAETFEVIKAQVKAWEFAGNSVASIIIDYPAEKPDFAAVTSFVKGLKAALEQGYRIDLVGRPGWFDDKDALGDLWSVVSLINIDLRGAAGRNPGQELAKIDHPFRLILDKDADLNALYPEKSKHYIGRITDLTP